MPKVSVIMPVYNIKEEYLREAIESILNQTFGDFEVICVNDGSTDNSSAILSKFASKDDRIKIINQQNLGLSCARNTGLDVAKGEYVCFLDSDDAIHPQLLELTVRIADENNLDMVAFKYQDCDGNSYFPNIIDLSKLKYKISDNPLRFGFNKSKYCIPVSACAKLYKRNLLENIRFIPKIHFEDVPFTCAVLAKKPKTAVIDYGFYYYTCNQDSIMHKKSSVQQIKDYRRGISFICETYQKLNLCDDLKFISQSLFPGILKQQYNRCLRADNDIKSAMLKEFTDELVDLKNKQLLSWHGHKITKYLAYRKLIKGYKL